MAVKKNVHVDEWVQIAQNNCLAFEYSFIQGNLRSHLEHST